jgi:membrane-associated phospholipid phosphatase
VSADAGARAAPARADAGPKAPPPAQLAHIKIQSRPPGVEVFELVTQASFPSGHVMRTVVTAGVLAAVVWRRVRPAPAMAAAVLAVVVMGFARIASGEHWFTDVVGAVLLGIGVLAVIGFAVDLVARRRATP